MAFLGQYDGLAYHFDGGQDPALQLRAILATYIWGQASALSRSGLTLAARVRQALALQQRIVNELLALEFVTYRARISPCYGQPGRDWNPATQPWLAFIDSLTSEEGYLQVWRSENTKYLQTHMEAIRSYLLAPVTDLCLASGPPPVLGTTA